MAKGHQYLWLLGSLALLFVGALIAEGSLLSPIAAAPAGQAADFAPPGAKGPQTCAYLWQTATSANGGSGSNHLSDIAGLDGGDIWAVGYYTNGSTDQTLIVHWNGSNWAVIPSPNDGSGANHLNAVTAIATNDVWAVGYAVDSDDVKRNLAEHWNGSSWAVVATPGSHLYENILFDVAAATSHDAWAVGYQKNTNGVKRTLTEHWNGSSWSLVTSANNTSLTNILYGVAAVAGNNFWAVGNDGYNTLTEHWNGSTWSLITSPTVGADQNVLNRVAAVDSSDVWAIGYYFDSGRDKTLTMHWNGVNWVYVASPNVGTGQNQLTGLTAWSTADVWTSGHSQSGSYEQTLTEHWNGTAWSAVSSPNIGTSSNELDGIVSQGTGDVWAVGVYYNGPVQRTLAEHYSLVCSTPSPTPTATATVTTGGPTPCPVQFSDVDQSSPFYTYVRCLACRGIVAGYGGSPPCAAAPCFLPGNPVTRGQVAKFVSNAAGYAEAIPSTQQTFTDVPYGNPFWVYIERAYAHGVISGYTSAPPCPSGPPCFLPNNNVTRGQTAKFVSNAAAYADTVPTTQQTFSDVPPSNAFWVYTERAALHGVISGYTSSPPCTTGVPCFLPGNNVTRGQTSKFIANAFFPNCQTPARP